MVRPQVVERAAGEGGKAGAKDYTGIGQIGIPAERIGKTTAKRMAGYLAGEAFAGPYLQDQLLLPFAIARGGVFTTVKISQHTRTAMELIKRFTGTGFRVTEGGDRCNRIEVAP